MPARLRPPAWLTALFHEEAMSRGVFLMTTGPPCWLAQHDPEERECEGKLEAFHFIGRQRIRNYLTPLVRGATVLEPFKDFDAIEVPAEAPVDEIVQLAEWDSRNAGPGCEMHHRRLDLHLMPPLIIHEVDLPFQVIDFAYDWGLETCLVEKYSRPPSLG